MPYHKTKKKRTISPEQLQKMKEGRERAQKARQAEANQKRQVAKLSDLNECIYGGLNNDKGVIKLRRRRTRHR